MIYLKKPDGTIQQIETEDEQQMRQALNIDKQLAAQKGEDFGEVYDADSLPDEDKVKLGLMTKTELDAKNLAAENAKKVCEARQYLADTDYKIIKQAELGEKCPADVLAKRAECRAVINKLGA